MHNVHTSAWRAHDDAWCFFILTLLDPNPRRTQPWSWEGNPGTTRRLVYSLVKRKLGSPYVCTRLSSFRDILFPVSDTGTDVLQMWFKSSVQALFNTCALHKGWRSHTSTPPLLLSPHACYSLKQGGCSVCGGFTKNWVLAYVDQDCLVSAFFGLSLLCDKSKDCGVMLVDPSHHICRMCILRRTDWDWKCFEVWVHTHSWRSPLVNAQWFALKWSVQGQSSHNN